MAEKEQFKEKIEQLKFQRNLIESSVEEFLTTKNKEIELINFKINFYETLCK